MSEAVFVPFDAKTNSLRVWDAARRLSMPAVRSPDGVLGHEAAWVLNALLEQRPRPQRELVAALKKNPEWASMDQAVLYRSFTVALMRSAVPERELKGVVDALPPAVLDQALLDALEIGRWLSAERLWHVGARFSEPVKAENVALWMLEPWRSWWGGRAGEDDSTDPVEAQRETHRKAALEVLTAERAKENKDSNLVPAGDLLMEVARKWVPRFQEAGLDASATLPIRFSFGATERSTQAPFLALALDSTRSLGSDREPRLEWARLWLGVARAKPIDWERPSEWHRESGVPLGDIVAPLLPQDPLLRSEFETLRWDSGLAPAVPAARLRL